MNEGSMNFPLFNNTLGYSSIVTEQIKWFSDLNDSIKIQMQNKIKTFYEEKDDELRKRYSGGYNGYKLYGKREIGIITEWGEVRYSRTRFKYYDVNKQNKDGTYGGDRYVFLLDIEVGRKPYQRIIFDLYIKILKELDSGKRYRDIRDMYKFSGISLMTISNINRSVNIAEYNKSFQDVPGEKIKTDKEFIYLGLDDTYTNLFKAKKQIVKNMVRVAFLHTGIDWNKSTVKRKFLENKRLLMLLKTSNSTEFTITKFKDVLWKFITNNYNLTNKKLIVMGDGAEWIKELAKDFHSDYVLDEFHLMAKVHKCFSFRRLSKDSKKKLTEEEIQKKAIYADLYALVRKGEVDLIIEYIRPLLRKSHQELLPFLKDKKSDINKLLTYIIRNKEGIANYKNKYYIGSQTESQISHNVKALKSYGAKAYSELTFSNMLSMRMAKVNEWDPIGLIVEEHEHQVMRSIEYFRQNIWTKENTNKIEYEPKQGSVPILGWRNTGLTKMIREILTKKN